MDQLAGVDLSITNPAIWGPMVASIAAAFIFEIIVSGRAYKRLQDENIRLRAIIENVIPLGTAAIDRNSDALRDVLDVLEPPNARTRSRRN
ncbi:hypothetical protein AB0G15_06015 [Streptosporangium sp. NPDC023825]|uniref:hypothetical protein n=1 Tax=Streptosporangium sp. NPDC023825 TaxID=3154909 RepID=UPI00343DD7BF